jgi:hypothetical protein
MAAHLTRHDCEWCSEVLCIPCNGWGTNDDSCGVAVKCVGMLGMLGVSVRKMKAMTVKMETVTLIGKGRSNLTCFVY